MDTQQIVTAVATTLQAIKTLRDLIPKLPSKLDKDLAEHALKDAEEGLQVAHAQAAQHLGFVLCYRHWPPAIMVDEGDMLNDKWRCLTCGKIDGVTD